MIRDETPLTENKKAIQEDIKVALETGHIESERQILLWQERTGQAEERVRELQKTIKKLQIYIKHSHKCQTMLWFADPNCTCGLEELLKECATDG